MGERRGTKALELWCKRMTEGYVNVKIDNMTTSWRDGLAFCAMIHHFRPDLIDFDKLNQNDIYYNNDLAFRTAEQYLSIPALLDADDMASYEVPDRLSILTYLSQFYQVFGSQDSPNRLKRNSTSNLESNVSKPAASPPKMAHIVGVPKREPCQKCSLPVFLAERQIIGNGVYHRTCLKCARCRTQLTLGSFYETEIDGEFCCETCPDEEKTETFSMVDKTEDYSTSNLDFSQANVIETNKIRNSIADRLAFFEMNSGGDSKKLLQKSLSDEEKSKSLKKITTEFNPNSAFSNFMNSTINDDKNEEDTIHNSDSEHECTPPVLPKTTPPVTLKEQDEENLWNNLPPSENESNLKMRRNIDNKTYDALDSSTSIKITQKDKHNKYSNNDLNISVNVTKERKNKNRTTAELFIQPITDFEMSNTTKNPNSDEMEENLQQENVVLARLHQFDLINKSELEYDHSLSKNISDNDNKSCSISRSIEITNTKINLDNTSKDIVNTDKILTLIEKEKVPKYTDNDEDSFKLINDNQSYQQNYENLNVDIVDTKSSAEKQIVNAETATINQPTEVTQHTEEIEENKKVKLLEGENRIEMNTISKANDKTENENTVANLNNKEDLISEEINSVEKLESNKHVEKQPILLNRQSMKYPEELNPFQSDDTDDDQTDLKEKSSNPFGSDADGDNIELTDSLSGKLKPPPRPPPPKISKNPFGSESDNDDENDNLNNIKHISNYSGNLPKKTPIPTPRTQITPLKQRSPELRPKLFLDNSDEFYGSSASLNAANYSGNREIFHRHHEVRGSNTSLNSSSNGRSNKKSKKAPAPPPPTATLPNAVKELFATEPGDSMKYSPNSSGSTTPQQPRKKRPAPKPPALPRTTIDKNNEENYLSSLASGTIVHISEIQHNSEEIQQQTAEIKKLSDEEKVAHLNVKKCFVSSDVSDSESETNEPETSETTRKRLIPLNKSLIEDSNSNNDIQVQEEQNVIYRRSIRPPSDIITPTINVPDDDSFVLFPLSTETASHNRQLEKMKDNKEAKNRNRQSQCSDDSDPLLNKSTHGKWKRRKGPAPSLPIPPRKVLQMLPLQEIRHELEIIEVQQQGLEKQGVILETMIRERCESKNDKLNDFSISSDIKNLPPVPNSKEVEDLILQLFELVNEKNELFRRQAELMYLRRQHRLEQEQADLEYEIRVLMAQPERNKTDSDKAREEALIARLVEVVQLRNEVIECLEMDRLREAEEDLSIKQRLELHTAKRDEELNKHTPTKLSKKEKKKQKEIKKLGKSKKLDADKDADESELNVEKEKKKKKKFLF